MVETGWLEPYRQALVAQSNAIQWAFCKKRFAIGIYVRPHQDGRGEERDFARGLGGTMSQVAEKPLWVIRGVCTV